MQHNLAITPSPHVRSGATTRRIMQDVCIALAPAGIASVILFGGHAAVIIAVCVLTCVLTEYVYQRLMNQRVTAGDWSAVVTGLLLAYNIPANAPIWIPIVGSVFAILIVKQLFGGIGSNFMNPALTARAVLFVSWSSIMTAYPNTVFMTGGVDTVSSATPLAALGKVFTGAEGASLADVGLADLFLGNCAGVLGETCKLALILGGIYLFIRKVIDWRIPVCMIGTVAVMYLLTSGFNAELTLKELLSGGLMLGAIFMATDYATSPQTNLGRIIFGVGCGLLLFVIRAYASYPEGCSFAILFMNVCSPLIDRWTAPTPFGEVKQHG
ncbi:MAG: RnfABCDGE type electron transport complex subunit D [Clostridia bacterium]|nr:RnfABCDGE type electron transport complex subunit D [Clostridia bacterium]MBR4458865.1 RnfABCDGE type electron transport complex subunit D [Clostridia bacterium]